MELITINSLGIEKSLWEETPPTEKNMYNLISIILIMLIIVSVVSMSFIGFAVTGNWVSGLLIGIFFSFLFYNIYRFAIVSLGFVLGKKETPSQSSAQQPLTVGTKRTAKLTNQLKNLRNKLSFSSIVRFIVVLLIGFVISFGWNLAINWPSVTKLNSELSQTLPHVTVESNTIYLTQTAIYITQNGTFTIWTSLISGALIFGLYLKRSLITNPTYQYAKLARKKFEQRVDLDYNELSKTANIYFSKNKIQYVFDSAWKNPPYRTEYSKSFVKRTPIDITTLTKGK
ncbi:MAG: hypothetical protein ACKO7P_13115 [Bacteroidota bacterium]